MWQSEHKLRLLIYCSSILPECLDDDDDSVAPMMMTAYELKEQIGDTTCYLYAAVRAYLKLVPEPSGVVADFISSISYPDSLQRALEKMDISVWPTAISREYLKIAEGADQPQQHRPDGRSSVFRWNADRKVLSINGSSVVYQRGGGLAHVLLSSMLIASGYTCELRRHPWLAKDVDADFVIVQYIGFFLYAFSPRETHVIIIDLNIKLKGGQYVLHTVVAIALDDDFYVYDSGIEQTEMVTLEPYFDHLRTLYDSFSVTSLSVVYSREQFLSRNDSDRNAKWQAYLPTMLSEFGKFASWKEDLDLYKSGEFCAYSIYFANSKLFYKQPEKYVKLP